MLNHHLGTGPFVHQGIISAVKRIEFISDNAICNTKEIPGVIL